MGAAAVPVLTKVAPYAISAVGSLFGRKASGPSKAQQQAMDTTSAAQKQLSGAAAPLMGQGQQLSGQGSQYLGQAGKYYSGILGSRQQARESLAPEMSTALEYYRGAGNKAKRTLTGGVRDQAVAELDRQKVGQLAGMIPAARRSAAEGLGNLGGTALQGGTAQTGQAANLLDTSARIGTQQFGNATTLRNQEQAGGRSWGGTIFDILKGGIGGKKGSKGGGGGGILPSGSYAPGLLMGGPGKMG
jgi:hypothetical protein